MTKMYENQENNNAKWCKSEIRIKIYIFIKVFRWNVDQ